MRAMLVGFILDGKHSGIDKYLLGFCDAAREAGVRLDFLTQEIAPELRDHLASFGFGLIAVPGLKHPVRQYRALRALLEKGDYDAVYLNLSEAFNALLLMAAKGRKIPVRIAHSHSSGVDRDSAAVRAARRLLHKLFRPYLSRVATRRLACSSVAGAWMFDRPYEIINNAVNARRFAFDPEARERLRREMELSGLVLLQVGNCCYQKNQGFLLDVVREIVRRGEKATLLLVGEGPGLPALREKTAALGLSDCVRFLGTRTDVATLYSAADLFLLPSRFEGFPITCLEAQFSGVPCVLSDTIAPETRLAENVAFLKTDDPARWADEILRERPARGEAVLFPGSEKYDEDHSKARLLTLLR